MRTIFAAPGDGSDESDSQKAVHRQGRIIAYMLERGLANLFEITLIVRGKRGMMASVKRRILLADHTKFSKVALHKLASLQDFDLVVVDSGIDAARLDELRECSVPSR